MSTNKKILVVGHGYKGPFEALGNVEVVSSHMDYRDKIEQIAKYDLVVFTGGEDVNPAFYGREPHCQTSFTTRDYIERELFFACLENGIPMTGICRGLQFITVMTGGVLAQDVSNHAIGRRHLMHTIQGSPMSVNSLHHQMCCPKKGTFELVGWAESLSKGYYASTTMDDLIMREDGAVLEPEALWFPKYKAFGVQYHPEMLPPEDIAVGWYQTNVRKYLLN